MKKLLILFCMLLPLLLKAQNVKTLKRQADSLRKLSQYQKAEPLYQEAINLVLTYQDKVGNDQWVSLSLAAQQNHIKAFSYTDDKTAAYVNWEYGSDGPKLKAKINDLIKQKDNFVFTYQAWGGGSANFYIIKDTLSNTLTGYAPAHKKFLFWVTTDGVFMQAFSEANIYEPLKIGNKALVKFLKLHSSELPTQVIERSRLKESEKTNYDFSFYAGGNIWNKEIYDAYDTIDPTINSHTVLYQLLPLIEEQEKGYNER